MTQTEPSEEQLVALARSGDRAAFGALYERHHPAILRFIQSRVAAQADAEDLAAQVFLRAWEAMPGYETRGSGLSRWLYQIARNMVLDHFRAQRSRPVAALDAQPELVSAQPPVEEQVLAKERAAAVAAAVRQLPAEQRRVILLRFVRGLRHQEIASAIAKSPGAARVIQHRALSALQTILTSTLLPLILLIGALLTITVTIAQRALPDEPLYGIKLASERARLAAQFSPTAREELARELRAERRAEVLQLQRERRSAAIQFSGTLEALDAATVRVSEVALQRVPETQIDDDVRIGGAVNVRAAVRDGAVIALQIARDPALTPDGPSRQGAAVATPIRSLTPTPPAAATSTRTGAVPVSPPRPSATSAPLAASTSPLPSAARSATATPSRTNAPLAATPQTGTPFATLRPSAITLPATSNGPTLQPSPAATPLRTTTPATSDPFATQRPSALIPPATATTSPLPSPPAPTFTPTPIPPPPSPTVTPAPVAIPPTVTPSVTPVATAASVSGSGSGGQQTRTLPGFSAIDFQGVGQLTITQGSSSTVTISGGSDQLDLVETPVIDGVLVIRFAGGASSGVVVNVSTPDLRALTLSGSGAIVARGLNLTELTVTISGVGSVTLDGSVLQQRVALTGAGTYAGCGLLSRRATVNLAGSGSITVQATDELTVDLSGVGSIVYLGTPNLVQTITGAGTVDRIDACPPVP